jgi:hypothetical protein
MTLDKYSKWNVTLREKYKSLNDEQFINLASENMAKLYVKILDHIDSWKSNKYIDKRIEKLGKKYDQWSDQVNIVEFKKTLRKKFLEVSIVPYINETLLTSRHIININWWDLKNSDDWLVWYSVSFYNNEDEMLDWNSLDKVDLFVPIKSTNEEIEKRLADVFSIMS